MVDAITHKLLSRVRELETRIEESDQLIEAIKAGQVDAFAINNKNKSEIFTLESGDYAYRMLIEEFDGGVINVTEEGLIVYTNPYFFNLLRTNYEEVIGTSIFDLIHPASREEFQQLLQKATECKKSKGEIKFISKNSIISAAVLLTSLQPKLSTVGIIISDLTSKIRNEEVLMEYQRDLENKNRELLQSNAELASFAYIASHDLQEPLRKIQSFASQIQDKEANNLSDKGLSHFERIKNAACRMQMLIEDILAYSRINSVERRFVPTDLNTVVDQVLNDMKEEIQQRNALIKVGDLCNAKIIPFQIRQMFQNLLSNSLKFMSNGITPVIEISSKIERGLYFNNSSLQDELYYCQISFSDNGIGFDQEHSEIIFDLFQRLHNKSQYKGTGIGLAIVKKIIDNHNGFIAVNSRISSGTQFDFYLPSF